MASPCRLIVGFNLMLPRNLLSLCVMMHLMLFLMRLRMLMNAVGMNSGSYASLLQKQPNKKLVRNSELRSDKIMEGAAIAIPLSVVEEVSARFENTLYGYFIGNRLAFSLVENYVKNIWASSALRKQEIKKASVWVKMHHVPIAAYSEVGLSLITTQIGCPIMLDSYTSNMYVCSWGKNGYARALIEVSADRDLMESIVIVIPLGKGKGHTLATIEIEYEWKPPICSICKILDHTNDKCPKHPKVLTTEVKDNDGFVEVTKKKKSKPKGKASTSSPKQPVKEVEEVNVHDKSRDQESVVHKDNDMMLKNKFTVPNDDVENGGAKVYEPSYNNIVNTSDSEEVDEDIFIEDDRRKSWCLMGDFKAALFLDDLATGSSNIDISMQEFKACVENIEVIDIQQAGLKFTWNQKPKGKDGILKKLDRVLTNLEFNDLFQGAHAIFQPYRISDHSPAVLKIPWQVAVKPKPFKFTNILIKNPMFKEIVLGTWNRSFSGFYLYQVIQKLKCLKKRLRKLLYATGHIHENVKKLRSEHDKVQRALDLDPSNNTLHAEEAANVQAFNAAILLE
nr:RNA-directed DNA polymerase, eukaryota, reverse transcriptase zinc-binding domain protein [Tanacetum cinerariifolium]